MTPSADPAGGQRLTGEAVGGVAGRSLGEIATEAGWRWRRARIRLYQQASAVISLPQYVTALGDVYTKRGRSREAAKQYARVKYIGYLNAINKEIYNRDLALLTPTFT